MPENLPNALIRREPARRIFDRVDIGGPLNNMKDLIDTNSYTAFYDNPVPSTTCSTYSQCSS
jgi:hypothetical protein